MNLYLYGVLALFSFNALASDQSQTEAKPNPAQVLLHQMEQASEQLSYELSYILIRKNNIEPIRYRHSRINDQAYGQLLYLSGPPREVIQRGKEVSYFEPGIEPYTISNNRIVAPPLPSLLRADIAHLETMYDFVSLGRAREAGVSCDVVRVSPKDGERYAYVAWIDEKNKLLVRADLLDRDGEPIEQYRAISVVASPTIAEAMQALVTLDLPPPIMLKAQQNDPLHWKVTDLPQGFELVYSNRHRLLMTGVPVESQMFSDGLFGFSVYIAKANDFSIAEQLVRKGRRTLHSHLVGDTEITVVGDIPPLTAKAIAQSIRFDVIENSVLTASPRQAARLVNKASETDKAFETKLDKISANDSTSLSAEPISAAKPMTGEKAPLALEQVKSLPNIEKPTEMENQDKDKAITP